MAQNNPNSRNLADLIQQGKLEAPPKQLTQEEKEELAAAHTPFTITGITYGDSGDFGPYFEFDAVINGQKVTFRLSSNEKRDEWLASLAQAAAEGPINGVQLRAIATRGGNKFLTIEPAS